MIVKRVRFHVRKFDKIGNTYFKKQQVKTTSFWLFGIIPLFISSEVIGGDYE